MGRCRASGKEGVKILPLLHMFASSAQIFANAGASSDDNTLLGLEFRFSVCFWEPGGPWRLSEGTRRLLLKRAIQTFAWLRSWVRQGPILGLKGSRPTRCVL